ncbi:hypothetical protein [Litchfieldella anticariensis]|uniref:hypothetical protein n=1 Tax=Litchfieldella anticariensis TaxID=258591 RepID=UPI0004096D05|nr:hypothetical protein [Halomonas anticariensis]
MAIAICLPISLYAPLWFIAMAVMVLIIVLCWSWCRERPWQCRWIPGDGHGGCWQYRDAMDSPWQDVSVKVTYLGPWLIALAMDGRHYWLWPDSAPPQVLRDLRRNLVAHPVYG